MKRGGSSTAPDDASYESFYTLSLTDPEHLSPAVGACTLCCWFTILHGDCLRVFHLPLGSAFYTIRLHRITSFFRESISYLRIDYPQQKSQ